MKEIEEIIKFLKEETGCDDISLNSDITYDLGIDGDDFADLISKFSTTFHVDISPCLWYFHCGEEGSWNSIGGAFFKSPDNRVEHIPITPFMLYEFTQKGKWHISYPEHKLPKRRYDLLINLFLVVGLVAFIIFKCAAK